MEHQQWCRKVKKALKKSEVVYYVYAWSQTYFEVINMKTGKVMCKFDNLKDAETYAISLERLEK